MKDKPKDNNILFYIALALLIVSIVVLLFNISKVMELTGNAIGTINLSIGSTTQINFTTNNITWGAGSVTTGSASATLYSAGGVVTNGNWTANSAGLVLENIGNQNVSIDLAAGLTASSLLAGNNPSYQWNVSNVEAGSCTVGGFTLSSLINVNNSARVCSSFSYNDSIDSLRIDIKLVIPSDSKTGVLGDTITATATAVA